MSGASWQARVECGGVVHGAGVLVSPTTVLTYEDEDGYGHPHDTVGDEAPPRAYRTKATFEFADGARHPDTVAALGRAVTRVLTASGPARHTLRPTARDNGWTVVTAPGMAGLPLLHATMRHFEDEVVQLGGLRWLVTFECLVGDGRIQAPDAVRDRRTLDVSEDRRGIVAVPQMLRDELDEDPDLAPWLQSLRPGTAAGWYRLCRMARLLLDGTHLPPPVLGPHPLPSGDVFPEGAGEVRTVVYRTGAGELGTTRRPGATEYFEIDFAERRLELDERESFFRAIGTAVWRVSDPLRPWRTRTASRSPSASGRRCASGCGTWRASPPVSWPSGSRSHSLLQPPRCPAARYAAN